MLLIQTVPQMPHYFSNDLIKNELILLLFGTQIIENFFDTTDNAPDQTWKPKTEPWNF